MVALRDLGHGESMRVWVGLFVHKLKVEVLSHIGSHDFQIGHSKCFSEANSFATIKGTEAHWVSFLATRRQGKWVVDVEPFGQELSWALPLVCVAVKSLDVHQYFVTCLDLVLTDLNVLTQDRLRCNGNNRHETEGFICHVAQIGQIFEFILGHMLLQIIF